MKSRMLINLALACAACSNACSLARADDNPGRQDLVFLGDERPVLVRLQIEVDGKPFRTFEQDYYKKLFRYFDRNEDGVLDKEEVTRAPRAQAMQQARLNGYFFLQNVQPSTIAEFDTQPFDEKVSIDEFIAYYHKANLRPFQLVAGQNFSSSAVNDMLYKYLDRDGDAKISKAEFEQAESSLRKFDVDDDEIISLQEITQNQFFNQPNFGQPGAPVQYFTEPDAARVMTHYDRNKDKRLSRGELGIKAALFDRLDQDKDDALSATELAGLFAADPDLDLVVRLGKTQTVEDRDAKTPAALKEIATRYSNAELRVSGAANQAVYNYAQQYQRQFDVIDAKKQGFVELKDLNNPQYQFFKQQFTLMDKNADGKLTKEEMNEFGAVLGESTACYISVTVSGRGQGLFELLDSNNDQRLGVRELRTLWSRIAPQDTDKDGSLAKTELPEQVMAVVSPGRAAFNNGMVRPPVMGIRPQPVNPNQPARGPAWFRKMDANADGDVSRREFIGAADEFKQLDKDGDGLISLEEAEPAKAVNANPPKGEPVKAIAQAPLGGKIGPQFNDPAQQQVFRSAEELKKATGLELKALAEQLKFENIDFGKHMLVHVTGGTQNTGGSRVEITRVARDDQAKTMTVSYKVHAPQGAATNAITHPGTIILVDKFDGTVKFAAE